MNRAAAALTWDGARFPAGRLPARARSFLGAITPATRLPAVLAQPGAFELRICWIPCLRGGPATLTAPFLSADGRRILFRLTRTVAFGNILGAVYRRAAHPPPRK